MCKLIEQVWVIKPGWWLHQAASSSHSLLAAQLQHERSCSTITETIEGLLLLHYLLNLDTKVPCKEAKPCSFRVIRPLPACTVQPRIWPAGTRDDVHPMHPMSKHCNLKEEDAFTNGTEILTNSQPLWSQLQTRSQPLVPQKVLLK